MLERLTNARGVSGDEGEIRALLKDECQRLGLSTETDALGTLYARRPRPGAKRALLAAHMDEVGFLITGADGEGLLRYQTVGGIDPRVVVSKNVLVGKDRVPGVIGAKAIHLQSPEEMARVLQHKEMRVDIGAKDRGEAEKLCPPGAYAVFDSPLTPFGEGCVLGKALDDRVGCLALLAALSEIDLPVDLTCAFTVQEEVGLRGAQVAAQRLLPDLAIALEGTTCNDLGEVPTQEQVTSLGKGVVISFMDRASIASPILYQIMTECAKEKGIPHQPKRGTSGGNDAGAMQRSFGGRPTITLSVPCRYIHSANSVASLSDIKAQQDLLLAFLRDFARYEGRIFA